MIVNAKQIIMDAKKNKYAIAQFNINNIEWTKYILEECNKLNSPVILGASENSIKYMGGYKVVSNLIQNLDEELNIKIPVIIHLDHGNTIESCIKAIDNGFTSVMIDASKYDLKTNIEMTNQVLNYAKTNNVTVEAEIGQINTNKNQVAYVKVEDVIEFVKNANVDFLAPALGSVHGPYKKDPKLDYNTMKEISNLTDIPLVLHGASGINDNDLKKAIKNGICKININTELQIAWSNEVRNYLNNKKEYDPRKIIGSGEKAIKDKIKQKLEILGSINKA